MDLITREAGLQCQLEECIRKNILILCGFFLSSLMTPGRILHQFLRFILQFITGEFKNRKSYHGFFEGVGFVWFCMFLFVFLNSSEYCGIFKEVGPHLPPFSCLDKSSVEKEMFLCLGSKPHEIEDVINSPFCFLIPLFLFHDFLYFKKLF